MCQVLSTGPVATYAMASIFTFSQLLCVLDPAVDQDRGLETCQR
jgi:hypothetical protein